MKKASNEAHFVGKFVGKNNNNLQVIENNKKKWWCQTNAN